ncbi:MAG: type I restriction enzyme HsdR N-terminal domain-containing protein [Bacteroidota bacterium]
MTPEEWVRQHVLMFLIDNQGVPKGLIGVEKVIRINKMPKRFDILVYDRSHRPLILVECKAPTVPISQEVFDQAARYNLLLNVPFFFISNGIDSFFCEVDHSSGEYRFLEAMSHYDELSKG